MCCYCGLSLAFENCCQSIHMNKRSADTAEALMRSRYSAYVLGNTDYLSETWMPGYRPQSMELMEGVTWLGLEIVRTEGGLKQDKVGSVEFKANFMQENRLYCLHEKSYFEQIEGQWFYKRGDIIEHEPVLISMKQSCPCGSGKKFKHCCSV